jgi:electron transport complex protein RnfB
MASTRKSIDIGFRIRSTPVVLATDLSKELVAGASYIALAYACPCREDRECKVHSTSFGCLYLGEGARGIVTKGNAREINRAEAIAHIQRACEMGLVHMILWTSAELRGLGADASRALELCSCCDCCCISRRTGDGMKAYVDGIAGLGIARLEGDCNACGDCDKVCPFRAITILDDGPAINADRCKGCGRCMATCSQGALKVYPLEMVPSYEDGWHMIPSASYIAEILKTVR